MKNGSLFFLCFFVLSHFLSAASEEYFAIEVVDAESGRGIPAVRLRTVNAIDHWTDSAGRIAFFEPGLMGEEVFFELKSDGYEYPKDRFGYRGFRVDAIPGETHRVEMERKMVAERLYRLTGGGIYRDSVLLGLPVPIEEPVLNGKVFGQDSVHTAIYGGKVFWLWGDSLRPAYPLGNFHVSMATSLSPKKLDSEQGIDFEYFVRESGFSKEMAKMEGKGPTWLSGLAVLEEGGEERLVAGYAKVLPSMKAYERGLVVFDDEKEVFKHYSTFDEEAPLFPRGRVLEIEENDGKKIYFAHPLPLVRASADLDSMADTSRYEGFTPLKAGSERGSQEVERDSDGNLVWDWKKGTATLDRREQEELVKAGVLKDEEKLFEIRDWKTGKPVVLHAGTVNWNPFRKRWILIVSQSGGDSFLGEVWFAEADSPLGPWCYAEKIISHDRYTFYNPAHHPFLDRDDGRLIFIDGTYSAMFSGVEEPTPRYDYNQILYRLDLSDSRLDLPVAFYRTEEGGVASANAGEVSGRPLFWAWEKPGEGKIGVRSVSENEGKIRIERVEEGKTEFYLMEEEVELADSILSFEIAGEKIELPGKALPHRLTKGPVLPPVRPDRNRIKIKNRKGSSPFRLKQV